ncbi:MAG: biotin/lipoyl-containing protein [Candidatus Bathyarchaeia archaeon]
MSEYNIRIEDRTYRVELVKKQGKRLFEARVNEKPFVVKLRKSRDKVISPFTLNIKGKKYQVELKKIDRHAPFNLKVNNVLFKAQLQESAKRIATHKQVAKVVAKIERKVREEGIVAAPMAGKIASVKVKKGDIVKLGDVVCILEAMKMENEITATKAGKVQKVNVTEGTSVNEGDIIIVIK